MHEGGRVICCCLLHLSDVLVSAGMKIGSAMVMVACVVVIDSVDMLVCARMGVAPAGMSLVGMAYVWVEMIVEWVGRIVVILLMAASAHVHYCLCWEYWSWEGTVWWDYMIVVEGG